jgi:alcohol dehydrogenase
MNPESLLSFSSPVKINAGNRALETLPVELAGFDASKPLVIADIRTSGRKAMRTLTGAFGDSGMTLGCFDGVTDSVDPALINFLVTVCAEKGYDALIALGGGPVADVAKILNLALSMHVKDARQLSDETPIRIHLRPLVAVATAEATGLETSNTARFNGMVFRSGFLAPSLAVIDPRLARARDGVTIASAGIAALGRAAEAHINADGNPFRDAYSFAALRLLGEHLRKAVTRPGDRTACTAVANAVAMSGCVFSNTDDSVLHRLAQAVYDMRGVHPGVTMALSLLPVFEEYRGGERYDIASLLQPLAGDETFVRTPPEKRADEALSALGSLVAGVREVPGVKMPRNLEEAGVPRYVMDDIFEVLDRDADGAYLRSLAGRIWNGSPPA